MDNQEAADELQYAIDLIKQDGKDWLDERDIPILEAAISALQALDEIYAFIMKSEASETTDGVLEIFDAFQAQENLQPTCNQLATVAKDTNVPCKDSISRQDAIDALGKIPVREFKKTDGLLDALVSIGQVYEALKQLPSAQPKRKKGKWIKLDMHAYLADHKCTACGQECYVPTCMGEPMYAYCPNCGADMREDQHDQSK